MKSKKINAMIKASCLSFVLLVALSFQATAGEGWIIGDVAPTPTPTPIVQPTPDGFAAPDAMAASSANDSDDLLAQIGLALYNGFLMII